MAQPLRESKAASRSNIKWGVVAILLAIVAGAIFAFPGVYRSMANGLEGRTGISLPRFNIPDFHLGLDLQGGAHLVYEVETATVPSGDRNDAVAGVRDVIEQRVNAFGIGEPLVQTNVSGDIYRVIVELPGVVDVKEAIKQIGETPLLEFKEQNPNPTPTLTSEQEKQLLAANEKERTKAKSILATVLSGKKSFEEYVKEFSEDTTTREQGGDIGYVSAVETGETWQRQMHGFVEARKLTVGSVSKDILDSDIGYHIIKLLDTKEVTSTDQKIEKQYHVEHILIDKTTAQEIAPEMDPWLNTKLSGKQLDRASVQFNQQTGETLVSLQFDDDGKQLFEDITGRNVGKPVAIFLDGNIISAPRVIQKITGGNAVITGNFTVAEAKLLAQRLNAGALPLPVHLVSQSTVGPILGKVSLHKSLIAGAFGFVLVLLFMILYYRLPGLLAGVALVLYTLLVLALFKEIPVTLTLAGVAGLILSIGMAVDANVLIFERIKEELWNGHTFVRAIPLGFERAWNSIRDGNVTTLLICAILYWFGTSIVRGFAFTLAIGVLISMFSAITISRILIRFIEPWIKDKSFLVLGARGRKQS